MKRNVLTSLFVLLAAVSALAAGNYPQPTICERACWQARAPQCTMSVESSLTRAVIHHTEVTTDYQTTSLEYSAARVRAHQSYHMDSLGWCDIGYHFLVDKLGNNFEGRAGSMTTLVRGAHDGVNSLSFGFSCMGSFGFQSGQDQPTPEMLDSLTDLIAWRIPDPFNGFGSGVYGGVTCGFLCAHRDAVSTSCPGDILYNDYIGTDVNGGVIRNTLYEKITGAPPTPSPTPTPLPDPPDAPPSNLTAQAVSTTQINIAWTDNATNEANYVVERKKGTGSYAVVATLSADTTAFNNTGLSKNTTYTYRVKATNGGGDSAYSNEASAKTPKK